ncbi:MAG: enoyl-CoA hydratase/isomerase family protein [Firmicutes bacterium]|nr:enoyl-CoA hydratase/isomerase family protein [Bacillota bacterium]
MAVQLSAWESHRWKFLLAEKLGDFVASITLNRPEVRNAFHSAMVEEWLACFTLLADEPQVRAVVISGAGGSFCAGADLKERNALDVQAWHAQHRLFDRAFEALRSLPMMTIAAVEGAAMGGGFELALACDLMVAAEGARFAFPEVKRGLIPGEGGTQVLARRVGPGRAKLYLASGRTIDAEEAERMGIADLYAPAGKAVEVARGLADEIVVNAPLAVAQAKRAVDLGLGLPLAEGVAIERELYRPLVDTQDRREGVRAFVEKRAPQFVGH